jgi:hypothetical protein
MVRIHPDPPTDTRPGRKTWGHSSAGRAPALQAGGHRFDPGWLHQDPESTSAERNEKVSAFSMLFVLFGCSLKIWKKQGESDCLKRSGSSG